MCQLVLTMAKEGSKRVDVDDKCQITAVFAGTLTGDFLPPQLVSRVAPRCCHSTLDCPTPLKKHGAYRRNLPRYMANSNMQSHHHNSEGISIVPRFPLAIQFFPYGCIPGIHGSHAPLLKVSISVSIASSFTLVHCSIIISRTYLGSRV